MEYTENDIIDVDKKEYPIDTLYFDIESHENSFVILIECDKEPEQVFTWQYQIKDEKFLKAFKRYYCSNEYCINEWITDKFDTEDEVTNYLESIGILTVWNFHKKHSKKN